MLIYAKSILFSTNSWTGVERFKISFFVSVYFIADLVQCRVSEMGLFHVLNEINILVFRKFSAGVETKPPLSSLYTLLPEDSEEKMVHKYNVFFFSKFNLLYGSRSNNYV